LHLRGLRCHLPGPSGKHPGASFIASSKIGFARSVGPPNLTKARTNTRTLPWTKERWNHCLSGCLQGPISKQRLMRTINSTTDKKPLVQAKKARPQEPLACSGQQGSHHGAGNGTGYSAGLKRPPIHPAGMGRLPSWPTPSLFFSTLMTCGCAFPRIRPGRKEVLARHKKGRTPQLPPLLCRCTLTPLR
jgi:hypothetical protein